jgi:hypothetical protein
VTAGASSTATTGAWATFGTALQAVDERIGLGVMRASMWNAS